MSIKLKKTHSFRVRVHVSQPTDAVDGTRDASFVARFKYLDRPQFNALMESEPSDEEFLEEVLLELEEVVDDDDRPVPFDVARESILNDLAAAGATVRTYIKCMSGEREKNSLKSRKR